MATTYVNEIEVRGTIVHKYATDKTTILTISTGKATTVPNYPKVVFFGDIAKKVDTEYNLYDNVSIKGNVQSSRRVDGEKVFYTQSIFGEEIGRTPKEMENAFGLEGEKFEAPINEAKIAGVVTSVSTPSTNIVKFNVKTIKNGRNSVVQLFFFTKEVGTVMETIRPQDNICVIGTIQTTKKERKGETVHFENVVVSEIQKF